MSNPSLLCVPYRFKTSKLYSQIPDSGLGDFTVTRATTPTAGQATRVNAAGFIELVADNVPRLDYPLGGITAGCPALLVEPLAQNICPRSQEIDLWTPTVATTTPNAAISPGGTQNAELFVPNSGSTGRTEINIGTLTNATTYTMTCFMKQHTASLDQITLYVSDGGGATGTHRWGVNISLSAFTLSNYTQSNGSVTSTSIENYGNGWYRIRVTGQVTSGMTSTSVVVIRYFGSTANGTNGVLVFGAQFELGSVPTSYIPTAASSVTRGSENVFRSTSAGLIGTNQGTIYAEVLVRANSANSSTRRIINISTDGSNVISLELGSTGLGANFIVASTAGGSKTIGAGTLVAGVNKIAAGYSLDAQGMTVYLNGVFVAADTLTAIPSLQSAPMAIGSRADLLDGTILNDRIRAVAIYPTRLPNTGPNSLQSLTTL